MYVSVFIDPDNVAVAFGDVGALLLQPRLYMLRITGCLGSTDAIDDADDVGAPPALVIQGMATPDPGHGLAFIVSTGAYAPAAANCASWDCCC